MSLKDAIREAAVERDKKDNTSQEVIENVEKPNNPDNKTASSKAVNTASSKNINTASKIKTNTAVKSKTPIAPISTESEDGEIELAALTIRVPRNSRIHWLVSAKKQNTTLTAAITEALNERFGIAED